MPRTCVSKNIPEDVDLEPVMVNNLTESRIFSEIEPLAYLWGVNIIAFIDVGRSVCYEWCHFSG